MLKLLSLTRNQMVLELVEDSAWLADVASIAGLLACWLLQLSGDRRWLYRVPYRGVGGKRLIRRNILRVLPHLEKAAPEMSLGRSNRPPRHTRLLQRREDDDAAKVMYVVDR